MVENALPESKEEFKERVSNISDKDIVESLADMPLLMAIDRCKDSRNYADGLFHVYPLVRSIWGAV